jgi:hypothetical protein
MSSIIHPVRQTFFDETPERQYSNVADFNQPADLASALELVARLEDEIHLLREALARAERASAHRETLLRNAARREQELRTELIGNMRL